MSRVKGCRWTALAIGAMTSAAVLAQTQVLVGRTVGAGDVSSSGAWRYAMPLVDQIRAAISNITGGEIEIQEQEMGPPTGKPVNIEIAGDDFTKLGEISEQIKREIKDIPGLTDMKDNFDEARPEIKVIGDRERAALYGLNTAMIGSALRTAMNGTTASTIREGEEEYDVTVRLSKEQRNQIGTLDNMYVSNNKGNKIPISSVGQIEFSGGIGAINRKDLKRVVTVSANATGRLGNEVFSLLLKQT